MADFDLIERTQFGDDTAFQELIEKYHRTVQLFILQAGVSPEDAEKATASVFVQAHRSIAAFSGKSVAAWLYRLAWNDIQACKKNGTDKEAATAFLKKNMDEQAESMQAFVDKLPEKYHVPFLLYAFHHQSYVEMKEILGTDEKTAEEAVAEARNKLQQAANKEGLDDELAHLRNNLEKLPVVISAEEIGEHLHKSRNDRKKRIGWLIAIGGTLSALSLGVFLLLSQSVLLPEEKEMESPPPEDAEEGSPTEHSDSTTDRASEKEISYQIEGMEETDTFQLLDEPGFSFTTYIPAPFQVDVAETGDRLLYVHAAFTEDHSPTTEPVWIFQEYENDGDQREKLIEETKEQYKDAGFEEIKEETGSELAYGDYAVTFQDSDNKTVTIILMENSSTLVKWEKSYPVEMADGLAAREKVVAEEWEWEN
ncbi:RNA polymerase sigma factor [Bacillus piscicola]|uniref:RNA polymerase sigma factor n=1 Tax=Bacillus piscicola TaxID=1632684 RepID=UPI001F09272D|nr:hypothetical protein [Bacillus piscicola]